MIITSQVLQKTAGSSFRSGVLRSSLLLIVMSLAPLADSVAAETQKAAVTKAATREKLDAAQKRLEEAAGEVADLRMSLSQDMMPPNVGAFTAGRPPRAVLGVNIGSGREDDRDEGVELLSVSPGGAAATAGLKAGDVVVDLNGKSLKRDGDDSPRNRLLAAMREVKPGDKVNLRYRRDGKVAAATVVAEAPADHMFFVNGAVGRLPGLPNFSFMRSEGVFGSAEMVALTPKLGRYFGTEKGLLVVRAPGDDRLKLEEGDVIVDIDGRVPESAAHASRILGSYEPGEKLRLNVLRMKQKVMLDVEVPPDVAGKRFERRFERSHFETAPGPGGPVTLPVPMPPMGPGAATPWSGEVIRLEAPEIRT